MVMLSYLKRELVPTGVRSVAGLAGRVGYEYLWHKAEDRALFLGKCVPFTVLYGPASPSPNTYTHTRVPRPSSSHPSSPTPRPPSPSVRARCCTERSYRY